jgi:uncharacterized membrane protein SpoIIM required for sporulation
MDLATFIKQRQPQWQRLESLLQRVEGSGLKTLDDEEAVEFGQLYRKAASDLNQAQTFVSGDSTVQYLNDLVARCYLVIYAKTRIDLWGLLRYYVWGYPAVFRRYFGFFVLATCFMVAGALFGALAMVHEPEVARTFFIRPGTIQPDQEKGEEMGGAVSGDWLAGGSTFYFVNNTTVSLITFALGFTFGIGTVWLLFRTGIELGALGVQFAEAGQFKGFCAQLLPHGVLELPAILIAGAAGFVLAKGLLQARPWSRRQELGRSGKQALWLLGGCVPLLAMAGFLEMVVARAPEGVLDNNFKLAVGGLFALLFLGYLVVLGWGRNAMPWDKEDRGQRTEDRGQRTEDRGQK